MATQILPLWALELFCGWSIGAQMQLVVQWTEQLLDQRVRILTLQEVMTLIPTSIIAHQGTFLHVVEEQVWWSSEILLSMSIIALRPLMLFVDIRTETCLIWVYHELFNIHCFFVRVQVLGKSLICHQSSDSATFLSWIWEWINLLLLLIQWLYSLHQKLCLERMKLIWRRVLTIYDNKWSIKVCRAVNFQMVCKCIPLETISITLQK